MSQEKFARFLVRSDGNELREASSNEIVAAARDIMSRKLRRGASNGNCRIFAIKAFSKALQQLHIRSVAPRLVIKDAEEAIAMLQQSPDSIGIIEIAGGCYADFFAF